MEVRAMTKYLPISPRKLRLVCDQVRGMDAQEAKIVLDFMPERRRTGEQDLVGGAGERNEQL